MPQTHHLSNYEQRFQKGHQLFSAKFSQICQHIRIAVIGLGGVGSWAAEALARMGIQHISLIDGDVIGIGNTNRQIHALLNNYGHSKALMMKNRLLMINPEGRFEALDYFLTANDLPQLINLAEISQTSQTLNLSATYFNPNDYDFILDCCDDFTFKFALFDWVITQMRCNIKKYTQRQVKNHLVMDILDQITSATTNNQAPENHLNMYLDRHIPFSIHRLVIAGAAGGKTKIQDLNLAPLSNVIQDPLLAKLRYQIRKKYKGLWDIEPYLKDSCCAYSQQAIQRPPKDLNQSCETPSLKNKKNDDLDIYIPNSSLNCAGFGSSINITATMGLLMAQSIQEKIERQLKQYTQHILHQHQQTN
jgi:tRNA threonylcarbamoyladenosine dehydratase